MTDKVIDVVDKLLNLDVQDAQKMATVNQLLNVLQNLVNPVNNNEEAAVANEAVVANEAAEANEEAVANQEVPDNAVPANQEEENQEVPDNQNQLPEALQNALHQLGEAIVAAGA